MKTLTEILKSKVRESMWVAIKDTVTRVDRSGNTIKDTKYRVVDLDTYKNLYNGTKLKVNQETGRVEKVEDLHPHIIRELGRSKDKSEARKFLPQNK